ncbi:hypothetical protein [Pseudoduganella armeniaca]|uniref:hypothetical protein n=1 Tax=Pseudoduganella armeniaca TaxID=2072590 RepID=UPI0027D9004E|nr:hypothetical protein [Pseudoduganella armeniaca]
MFLDDDVVGAVVRRVIEGVVGRQHARFHVRPDRMLTMPPIARDQMRHHRTVAIDGEFVEVADEFRAHVLDGKAQAILVNPAQRRDGGILSLRNRRHRHLRQVAGVAHGHHLLALFVRI